MKLATSTGDFWHHNTRYYDAILCFKDTKFKNINLELTKNLDIFYSESDDGWKALTDELEKAREDAGVTYVASHSPCLYQFHYPEEAEYRRDLRAIRRSMEIIHRLGVDRIVVHPVTNLQQSVEEFYKYNTIFYRDLLDLAEKYNITVMIENWDFTETHITTGAQMRDFLDYMDHPLLGACWDTAHCNLEPVARAIGHYENITALGKYLKGLHISDNLGIKNWHQHTFPFAGLINFDSVMQALVDINYEGHFTFEASYTLMHQNNCPAPREPWVYKGKPVTKLMNPSLELKKKAVDLLYETGKYILETYDCFEE